MEAPKDPDTDTVFALYQTVANEDKTASMRRNYLNGNYGYGHAKQALYEEILNSFGEARDRFRYYMDHLDEVDAALEIGAEKARKVADEVLLRVRARLGY